MNSIKKPGWAPHPPPSGGPVIPGGPGIIVQGDEVCGTKGDRLN
jgi:hypothetical protein